MQITGTKTTHEKVNIQLEIGEIFNALSMELRRRYCIPSDAYIDKETGYMVCDERNWRHGSVGTDILDKVPSSDKIAVLEALADMRSVIRNSKES